MLQYSAAEEHYRPGVIKLALSMSIVWAIQHRQSKTSILTIKERCQSNCITKEEKKKKRKAKEKEKKFSNLKYYIPLGTDSLQY